MFSKTLHGAYLSDDKDNPGQEKNEWNKQENF